MPNTTNIDKLETTIDAGIIHSFIALAYIFISASMIVIITKERENNAKHQQIISGVSHLAYWLSNFIVDWVKWMIPSMYFYSMFYLLNYEFYTEKSNGKYLFILFNLYGINNILFIYFISFMFESIGKA